MAGKSKAQGKSLTIDYEGTGRTFTVVTEMGGMMLFGSKLGAMEKDEKESMVKAWADYCQSQGVIDVPPGLALIIAMSVYTIPRALSPDGKARMVALFNKAKNVIIPKKEII